MFFSLREVAASSYSGARALQCPHHGAKTVEPGCQLSARDRRRWWEEELTLCENNVIGLDKVGEVVLLQLYDIGSGGGCRSCEQSESKGLGMHICYF